jgi:hypothetical protein
MTAEVVQSDCYDVAQRKKSAELATALRFLKRSCYKVGQNFD